MGCILAVQGRVIPSISRQITSDKAVLMQIQVTVT